MFPVLSLEIPVPGKQKKPKGWLEWNLFPTYYNVVVWPFHLLLTATWNYVLFASIIYIYIFIHASVACSWYETSTNHIRYAQLQVTSASQISGPRPTLLRTVKRLVQNVRGNIWICHKTIVGILNIMIKWSPSVYVYDTLGEPIQVECMMYTLSVAHAHCVPLFTDESHTIIYYMYKRILNILAFVFPHLRSRSFPSFAGVEVYRRLVWVIYLAFYSTDWSLSISMFPLVASMQIISPTEKQNSVFDTLYFELVFSILFVQYYLLLWLF